MDLTQKKKKSLNFAEPENDVPCVTKIDPMLLHFVGAPSCKLTSTYHQNHLSQKVCKKELFYGDGHEELTLLLGLSIST